MAGCLGPCRSAGVWFSRILREPYAIGGGAERPVIWNSAPMWQARGLPGQPQAGGLRDCLVVLTNWVPAGLDLEMRKGELNEPDSPPPPTAGRPLQNIYNFSLPGQHDLC